jgi:integrase
VTDVMLADDKGPSGATNAPGPAPTYQEDDAPMKATPGITRRHSTGCPARKGRRCSCSAGWEVTVYDASTGRRLRKTLASFDDARDWQAIARTGLRQGTVRAVEPVTIRDAAGRLVDGMKAGSVRNRSGDAYKPSVVAGYEALLGSKILPAFGAMRLTDLQRRHVQRFADSLVADGSSPSTVRNTLMPLRVIFRRAIRDGLAVVNPCEQIELPAIRGRRDRIVSPKQAIKLLAALPQTRDRALWATALYAGLRRGELMALRWQDLDLAGGSVTVERSYCPRSQSYVAPKSRSGRRRVPIAGALRDHLLDHRVALGVDSNPEALVFGEDDGTPFDYKPMLARARDAWTEAELEPVGLHEARHTCASVMIAAGVNIKALSEFLGHSSITITLDRYGHLLPGSIEQAAQLLDAFLAEAAETAGRAAESVARVDDK